ncbi:hypothetical protein LJR153_006492 [Paenibacillus sp. LjRoot153]
MVNSHDKFEGKKREKGGRVERDGRTRVGGIGRLKIERVEWWIDDDG